MTTTTLRHLRNISICCGAALIACTALISSASAAPKYNNSLDWVPADVAFYNSLLRNREQIEIVANSRAWAKLKEMPAVQMVLGFAQIGLYSPGGPGAMIQEFLDDPENQELFDLAIDAASHEIVVYGDKSAGDFLELFQTLYNAMQFRNLQENLEGEEIDEEATGRLMLEVLDEYRDRLAAPGMVMAFKVTDAQKAKRQIARLETVLKPLIEEEPQLRGRLKRASAGDTPVLVMEFDGNMIPWDEVPLDKLAERRGQFDKLKEKLQSLKMLVGISVFNDYLLVSVGGSLEPLAALGKVKPLAEVAELKPLEKFAAQRLLGISYVSTAFAKATQASPDDMAGMAELFGQMLPAAGLSEELTARMEKDLQELAADMAGLIPVPGANMTFSFLAPHGIESYGYDWSQSTLYDASKPLTILNHVGGDPILAYAERGKYSPDQYKTLRKWATKAFGYFEELAAAEIGSDEERAEFRKYLEIAKPLMARVDKATETMLMPALADGQSAFVLDAKISSKQWFSGLPQQGRALPMLEMGIVMGVSDAALLKKAFGEYMAVADDLVVEVRKADPAAIPADYKIPAPLTMEVNFGAGAGTVYWYKLPADWGVDALLTPNAGVGQHAAVMSFSPKTAARLMNDTPLAVASDGPLANRNKPLAAAFYMNWPALMDAVSPWIDMLVRVIAAEGGTGADFALMLAADDDAPKAEVPPFDDDSTKFVLDQVHLVIDVLKCLRTIESASYLEDGAMVTHSHTEFRDLK